MKKAFTMIELLVVMVVGAILSAIAVSKIHTSDVNDAARNLANDIRYTQYLSLNYDNYLVDDKIGSKDKASERNNAYLGKTIPPAVAPSSIVAYEDRLYARRYWSFNIVPSDRHDPSRNSNVKNEYQICSKRGVEDEAKIGNIRYSCRNMDAALYATDYLDETIRMDGDNRFDLNKTYGVKVEHSSSNGYFELYFDEFGVPVEHKVTSTGDALVEITSPVWIKLTKNKESALVCVAPYTGRVYISKSNNCNL
ncbi:type II secretion system protein [Campylobacter sp. MG1]|uniref:type II secretion system protein n=1 Tax=Campylobacter sp. MG1 TaxID=2976332 RepID=UPI00226CC7A3|nr:type II secretion system protein [Campylobacter sp. MG1]